MRRTLFSLLNLAAFIPVLHVSAYFWDGSDTFFEMGGGYRKGSLKWKTEANSCTSFNDFYRRFPLKTMSKLHWEDLQIGFIEAKGRYVGCNNVYLRASVEFGWIGSGKLTDRDYFGIGDSFFSSFSQADDLFSPVPISKSKSNANGTEYSGKIAIGYQFKICDDYFTFTPVVGYGWSAQRLSNSHLRHRSLSRSYSSYSSSSSFGPFENSFDDFDGSFISSPFIDLSDFSSSSFDVREIHSSYHTRWNGPFIGFDFKKYWCPTLGFFIDYEFHWVDYHAKGSWKLRNDFCDGRFDHHADTAHGNVVEFGIIWDICPFYTLTLKGEYQAFYAKHGHDQVKVESTRNGNVKQECFVQQPLRNVSWSAGSASLNLGMKF